MWAIEFWAPTADGNENLYLAYQDNPANGVPGSRPVRSTASPPAFFKWTFVRRERGTPATPGGSCFAPGYVSGPCTVTMAADLSGLGVKSGAALDSVTGLSVYEDGSEAQPPGLNVDAGYSNQADAATPFDLSGTGRLSV